MTYYAESKPTTVTFATCLTQLNLLCAMRPNSTGQKYHHPPLKVFQAMLQLFQSERNIVQNFKTK